MISLLVEHGGVDALIKAFPQKCSKNSDVAKQEDKIVVDVIEILYTLSSDDNGIQEILNKCLDLMLGIMKKNSSIVTIQHHTIAILQNLACNDETAKSQMAEKGAIKMVLSAMRRFPLNLQVQRDACGFFQNMTDSEETRERNRMMVKAGVIPKILKAVNRFRKEDTKLIEWGCNTIEVLAHSDSKIRANLLRKDAAHVLARIWLEGRMDYYGREAVQDAYHAVAGKPLIDFSPLFR